MKKPTLKESAINLLIIIIPVLLVWGITEIKDSHLRECTQLDIYEIKSEWSVCTKEGKQFREVVKKESFSCKNPGKVDVPEAERGCEYIPECNSEIEPCSEKFVYLFKKDVKEYTTTVKPENGLNLEYIGNKDNLTIMPSGKFTNAKLKIEIETTTFDGSVIKIPEYYYLFFSFNDDLRIIGTSRIQPNRLDLTSNGVFQGTETPKRLSFELSNIQRASTSTQFGSTQKNYVDILNQNSDIELRMSLFVGDGRSMVETDEMKRIYATITDAYIEYECEEGSDCKIIRIPELEI